MGASPSFEKVVDLGAVGSEYRDPLGLVLDYLVGDEPDRPPPRALELLPRPRPWNYSLFAFAQAQLTTATCRLFVELWRQWGEGPVSDAE